MSLWTHGRSKSFNECVALLNSLQSKESTIPTITKDGYRERNLLPEMRSLFERSGHNFSELNNLNIIHITGTKGKGSTCEFTRSIIEQYGKLSSTNFQIGVFTSPHLRSIRERIYLKDGPISEDMFVKYFSQLWQRLFSGPEANKLKSKTYFFRFLTLLAWHIFIQEKVNTAIIEVGIGGEYDATNIIERPTVASVSSISLDHTTVLGNTKEEIAWNKGGIFKSGVTALTVPQAPSVIKVLQRRACEKNVKLSIVEDRITEEDERFLPAKFQASNASLAVRTAEAHLRRIGIHLDENLFRIAISQGIRNAKIEGRCQIVRSDGAVWCYDGAHTMESIDQSSKWFCSVVDSLHGVDLRLILVFNQPKRDYLKLLDILLGNLKKRHIEFDLAFFTTNQLDLEDVCSTECGTKHEGPLYIQTQMKSYFLDHSPNAKANVCRTINDSIVEIRRMAKENCKQTMLILVAGSMHLVGGAMVINRH